jgi:CheY-like chemotaxis protein
MAYEHLRDKRILIVDDTPAILSRLQMSFTAVGCEVFVANDVKSALNAPEVDAAVVDMFIPEVAGVLADDVLRGIELCEQLRRRQPGIRFVGISEFVHDAPLSSRANLISKFVPKDYLPPGKTPVALLETMNQILASEQKPRMFIVHAHENSAALELKNFLQNSLGLGEPRLLRELAGSGHTLIELFEHEAHLVDLVFVIISPDDVVSAPRAVVHPRGNVLFELGYFYARLRRLSGRIIVLVKGDVTVPSDIGGIRWFSSHEEIRTELRGLGWIT